MLCLDGLMDTSILFWETSAAITCAKSQWHSISEHKHCSAFKIYTSSTKQKRIWGKTALQHSERWKDAAAENCETEILLDNSQKDFEVWFSRSKASAFLAANNKICEYSICTIHKLQDLWIWTLVTLYNKLLLVYIS